MKIKKFKSKLLHLEIMIFLKHQILQKNQITLNKKRKPIDNLFFFIIIIND